MSSDQQDQSPKPMPKALFGYDVIDVIGEGAGSVIFAVSDPKSGQIYAMKHVKKSTEKDIRFLEQLQNEFDLSRNFSHAALRKSVALKFNGSLFRKPTEAILVMELFDGIPLAVGLQEDVGQLVEHFIQVAKGLNALHLLGFVHCDLKPSNILVDARGTVKIIDFGQACKIGTSKERVQGTADFIAPEQVKCKTVGIETDVFNFGATFYWALCGQPLPTLMTMTKKEKRIPGGIDIPTPESLNPNVPQPLSALVMECVQPNAATRPDDFKELAHRLDLIHHSMQRQAAKHATAAIHRTTGNIAGLETGPGLG